MTNEQRTYQAYLLRLWQVKTAIGPVWHASLEDPHTGERKGFADLKGLFEFLKEETSDKCHTEGRTSGSKSFEHEAKGPTN